MSNIALLFSGQGSQYTGMGKAIYEQYDVAKYVYEEACNYLELDIKKLCFETRIEELTKTENTQIAVFVTSIAAYMVFQNQTGIKPKYFLGHSLGEITALTCAGAIDFKDALDIIRARGKFMQECAALSEGTMVAMKGADINEVKKMCLAYSDNDNYIGISNYNSPNEIVISGHKKAMREFVLSLQGKGITIIPLKVGAAFHSPLMRPAAEKLKNQLVSQNFSFGKTDSPVISNTMAFPYEDSADIAKCLSEQIVKPVQWNKSMMFLAEEGIETIIEIGPGEVLTKIARDTLEGIQAYSYDRNKDKIDEIFQPKKNISIENRRINFMKRCLAVAIATPNFNLEENNYKSKVSDPYKQINKLLEQLIIDNKEPDDQQLNQCIDMLKNIFEYKEISKEEQQDRLNELWNELGEDNFFKSLATNKNIILKEGSRNVN